MKAEFPSPQDSGIIDHHHASGGVDGGGRRQEGGGYCNDEDSTSTVSCTSSLMSLSPDNPLFCESRGGRKAGEKTTPGGNGSAGMPAPPEHHDDDAPPRRRGHGAKGAKSEPPHYIPSCSSAADGGRGGGGGDVAPGAAVGSGRGVTRKKVGSSMIPNSPVISYRETGLAEQPRSQGDVSPFMSPGGRHIITAPTAPPPSAVLCPVLVPGGRPNASSSVPPPQLPPPPPPPPPSSVLSPFIGARSPSILKTSASRMPSSSSSSDADDNEENGPLMLEESSDEEMTASDDNQNDLDKGAGAPSRRTAAESSALGTTEGQVVLGSTKPLPPKRTPSGEEGEAAALPPSRRFLPQSPPPSPSLIKTITACPPSPSALLSPGSRRKRANMSLRFKEEEKDVTNRSGAPASSTTRAEAVPKSAAAAAAASSQPTKEAGDPGLAKLLDEYQLYSAGDGHPHRELDLTTTEQALGEKLHHDRMPSTIMEESPLVFKDEDLSSDLSSENTEVCGSDDDEKHPLLCPSHHKQQEQSQMKLLQKKSTSLSDLVGLHKRHSSSPPSSPKSTSSFSGPVSASLSHPIHFGDGRRKSGSHNKGDFLPLYWITKLYESVSKRLLRKHYAPFAAATWVGFWALLHVTCANYVLTPMRDAIALQVGVEHMPKLTLASTVLAFCSSVPIGWLFEAPDPGRRRLWKRMGLTRGETQGTSLALFYRCFAIVLCSYAVGFQLIELLRNGASDDVDGVDASSGSDASMLAESVARRWWPSVSMKSLWAAVGQTLYIAFFLVVHLMKLHSLSLVWGVTTEAMEYEEVARKRSQMESNKTRLQRMALVGFGGTLGGILGSVLASSMAQILRLPGLLLLAAALLEISAELSIELGRIMQKHWEEQQLFQSSNDLASLDTSMKRSASLGSMKRVASGNSLNRIKSASDLRSSNPSSSPTSGSTAPPAQEKVDDDTFTQRLLRGITTILRSRLLMAVFMYNALYASTTVLLSFQRAALVANRKATTTTEGDTAFLANVNMASSVAIFALQASGLGAHVAQKCGPRGTLTLMPLIRLLGVVSLAWWHQFSNGRPPNLLVFLVVDECTKIMNLAVAKPVRESLWRGLSNEARYEAKPIVDTLANRWGGGSAAFLVSFLNKALDLFGVEPNAEGVRMFFGFPPILFLCLVIAAWWAVVSADLGQIRRRIDLELKKRQ